MLIGKHSTIGSTESLALGMNEDDRVIVVWFDVNGIEAPAALQMIGSLFLSDVKEKSIQNRRTGQ